eukprot:3233794-Rhodomonas_salina.1
MMLPGGGGPAVACALLPHLLQAPPPPLPPAPEPRPTVRAGLRSITYAYLRTKHAVWCYGISYAEPYKRPRPAVLKKRRRKKCRRGADNARVVRRRTLPPSSSSTSS